MAEQLPFTYTGADFYALCSDAMLKAVTRQASLVDAKIKALNAAAHGSNQLPISTAYFFDHHAEADDVAVMVTEQDFINAHRELIPSVSAGELAHYERVRAMFEGGRENNSSQPQGRANARSLAPEKRSTSGASRGSSRGKTKAANKGKGKAMTVGSDDEYNEDSLGDGLVNGGGHKGKGVDSFHEGGTSGDEGLYD